MAKAAEVTRAPRAPRNRSIDGAAAPAAKPTVSTEMKTTAKEFYVENKSANAAKSKADKARKKLLGLMDDAKVTTFQFKATSGDDVLTLEAEIKTGDVTTIDVQKLQKLVTMETFYKIVSATKASIEEFAGKDVYAQVSATQAGKGTRNVSVGPLK